MKELLDFRGRIGRIEWWFLHFLSIAGFAGATIGTQNSVLLPSGDNNIKDAVALFVTLPLMTTTVWIALTASIKRYNDLGKSGYWVFIIFVPFGIIAYLLECGFIRGKNLDNLYGVRDGRKTNKWRAANDSINTGIRSKILARRTIDLRGAAAARAAKTAKAKGPSFGRRENHKCPVARPTDALDQKPPAARTWKPATKANTLEGGVIALKMPSSRSSG